MPYYGCMSYDSQYFADLYATPMGPALWNFLNRRDNVIRMETATFLRRPAVEPLSTKLLEEFGSEVAQDRTKQMIGNMVRQIMVELCYTVEKQGVRIVRNRVFSTGTRYTMAGDPGETTETTRISREQREKWLKNTCPGEFNMWLDPQVRSPDGTLNLDRLYDIAGQHGIDPKPYQKLNPGQQRMIIGILLRAARGIQNKRPC